MLILEDVRRAMARSKENESRQLDMADAHTPEQRSRNMAAVRNRNTKPELRVRSMLHSLGFRFRLHRKDLPGTPDIVLTKHRTVILVHGCFWHTHDCRKGSTIPMTRPHFWAVKRQCTVERDKRNVASLEAAGWNVIVIWECQTRTDEDLLRALSSIHLVRANQEM